MAVKNYLIEGVSGSGKTTVAEELQRRGYHVIHGDRELAYIGDPSTGAPIPRPKKYETVEEISWLQRHWIWPVNRVISLIADQANAITFFCGGSRNHEDFIVHFDKVFVLEIDRATLQRRLERRPEDEFGGRKIEQDFILQLHASREDVPRKAVRINARPPVTQVVDDILSHCIE